MLGYRVYEDQGWYKQRHRDDSHLGGRLSFHVQTHKAAIGTVSIRLL